MGGEREAIWERKSLNKLKMGALGALFQCFYTCARAHMCARITGVHARVSEKNAPNAPTLPIGTSSDHRGPLMFVGSSRPAWHRAPNFQLSEVHGSFPGVNRSRVVHTARSRQPNVRKNKVNAVNKVDAVVNKVDAVDAARPGG